MTSPKKVLTIDIDTDLSSTLTCGDLDSESAKLQTSRTDSSSKSFSLQHPREAQSNWARTSLKYRTKLLKRWRKLILKDLEDWTSVVAEERGCTESEALTSEVLPFLEAIRFLEKNLNRILKPEKLGWRGRPLWLSLSSYEIHRDPLGSVLILAPSNYPLFLAGTQCIQALAAGNAVIWKPAPGCEGSARLTASSLEQAGLPENLLTITSSNIEDAIAAIQAGPDHIVLTGGHKTGEAVLDQLQGLNGPSTTFELSGCDAFYVREDADLKMAASALRFGLRLNQGRTCIAPRRVFVQKSVAAELRTCISKAFEGQPKQTFTDEQERKYRSWIEDAMDQGANPLTGSCRKSQPIEAPLVLDNGSVDFELTQKDLFGSVATIIEVSSDEDFLRQQEKCPYALGASIFSRNIATANSLAKIMNVGTVTINDVIAPTADPRVPFGGRKQSGHGVTRGRDGLLSMTQPKIITSTRGKSRPHFDPIQETMKPMLYRIARLLHGTWPVSKPSLISKTTTHQPTKHTKL